MGDREARIYRWRVGEGLWTDLSPGEDLWTGLNPHDFWIWQPLAVSGKTVYISTKNRKLFRSVDEGDTWANVSQNSTELGAGKLVPII